MKRRPLLVCLLGAALVIRTAFVWYFYTHPHPVNILDADNYTGLAAGLVEWGEFSVDKGEPSLDRPPGFPFFIALFYLIFGVKPALVLIVNVVLSTATCAFAFLLGRRLFSETAGFIALAFWVVYPYSIYYCGWAIRETFMTFLVALELWCLLEWQDKRTAKWAVVCGLGAAAISLTNPITLVFLGLVPLILLARQGLMDAARHAVFYYIVLGVLYAPWPIRNYRIFGVPVLTNIHGGKQFYQGMIVPPEAFGTEEETRILSSDPDYRVGLERLEKKDYVGANDWFKAAGRRWVLQNPLRYAGIVAHRVVKLWRLVPYERVYSHGYNQIFWASLLSDGLAIPLGLMGMFIFRKRWRDLLALYAAAGLWTLAYVLVFVVIRFRLPAMMVMIVFAAALLDRLVLKGRIDAHG
ncbi:MAG: glycosyltransferase family 39 protein [Elusimicrobiota bacterium]